MSTHEETMDQQPTPEVERLDVQMAAARLTASSSATSLGSTKTVIVPDNLEINPQVLAEALTLYQERY